MMEWTEAMRVRNVAVEAPKESERAWPQTILEFEELVQAVQHELVGYAYCRLQNREDAEDVVQDALVRIYSDRARHGRATYVIPYLYRSVANGCVDVLRKRKRTEELVDSGVEPARDHSADVNALLAGLPERQAEVIRLRIFADLPFDAIANVVGRSLPTVKSRFRYGIEKLRKTLSKGKGRA
jgi:RNA polymerase sigma-70 factor (ECF subfamily)